jgi:hypothetical protein
MYESTILFCDNQGTISLAKNPTHHAKTKLFDAQLHFIRDHIEKGTINIEYCPTEDTLADLMTKGLACEKHGRLLGLMGIRTCEVTFATPYSSKASGRYGVRSTSARVELRGIHTTPGVR